MPLFPVSTVGETGDPASVSSVRMLILNISTQETHDCQQNFCHYISVVSEIADSACTLSKRPPVHVYRMTRQIEKRNEIVPVGLQGEQKKQFDGQNLDKIAYCSL